jgi:hypothetical protein
MRIWDIPCSKLCRKHLLGEHLELHCIWSIITKKSKSPYINHPETKRWINRLGLLNLRHNEQVNEMKKRGWNHKSDLDNSCIEYGENDKIYWQTVEEQLKILKNKKCDCRI